MHAGLWRLQASTGEAGLATPFWDLFETPERSRGSEAEQEWRAAAAAGKAFAVHEVGVRCDEAARRERRVQRQHGLAASVLAHVQVPVPWEMLWLGCDRVRVGQGAFEACAVETRSILQDARTCSSCACGVMVHAFLCYTAFRYVCAG